MDFVEVRDESIVIPDGASHALVPIGVISDDLPELNESFYVRLTNVYLSAALQGSYGAVKTSNVLEFYFQNSRP